jgi:hypothetical protein
MELWKKGWLGTSSRSAAAKRLSAASLLFLCATVSPSTTHPHHHPYTQGTFTETVSIAFTLSFSHSTLTCHSHPHTIPCVPRSLTLNWPRLQILTGEDKDELLPLNLTEQGPSHSPLTVEWGLFLRYAVGGSDMSGLGWRPLQCSVSVTLSSRLSPPYRLLFWERVCVSLR